MGVYTIYAQNGGVIQFQTGDDEYFDVGKSEFLNNMDKVGGIDNISVDLEISNPTQIMKENKTLIGVMQEQNWNKSLLDLDRNNLLKAQNLHLKNQQSINYASTLTNIRNTQALLKSQDANTSMLNNLLNSLNDMKDSFEVQNEYLLSVFSEIVGSLSSLQQTIQQKDSQVSVNASFDSTGLESAINKMSQNQIATNQKIVEGIDNQNNYNNKSLEKIAQELDKNIQYNGQNYNKIEIDKMAQVEKLKGASDENSFSLNDGLDILEDFMTDGFDLDNNPLEYSFKSLKDELQKEFNEIKTQYGINNVGELQ